MGLVVLTPYGQGGIAGRYLAACSVIPPILVRL